MQIQMEIYYKEWAHLSMEAGMSQDLQGVSASGVPGDLRVQLQYESQQAQNPGRTDVSVQVQRQE